MSLDAEAAKAMRCVTAEDLRWRVPPDVLAEALRGLSPDVLAAMLGPEVVGAAAEALDCVAPECVSRSDWLDCVPPCRVRVCDGNLCPVCCDAHACPESSKVLP